MCIRDRAAAVSAHLRDVLRQRARRAGAGCRRGAEQEARRPAALESHQYPDLQAGFVPAGAMGPPDATSGTPSAGCMHGYAEDAVGRGLRAPAAARARGEASGGSKPPENPARTRPATAPPRPRGRYDRCSTIVPVPAGRGGGPRLRGCGRLGALKLKQAALIGFCQVTRSVGRWRCCWTQ